LSQQGSNLPGFREAQLAFSAHIRNPEVYARPADVEPRRMKIYLELFYNNIENFLANGFPVAKKILMERGSWHPLVRSFVDQHASNSPYFLEISQEFLTYLGDLEQPDLPGFLLELCHYEWVELALSVSELELTDVAADPDGDLLKNPIVVSPLIWKLAYRYPVHLLGERYQPEQVPDQVTHLVVNRRYDDRIAFIVSNAVTLRLLDILESQPLAERALAQLAEELPGMDSQLVYDHGIETLQKLRDAEILLGTEPGH
jgi:hypothetical protein